MIVANSRGLYPVDEMAAELRRLAQLATVVLNEHFNDKGLCGTCAGVAFPCASALLAEQNVAWL